MDVSSEEYWKSIKNSALSGNPDAEFEVAQIYDEGFIDDSGKRIVTKDPKRAVLWYRKSAEHGNPNAQNNFGYCLDNGYGIKKNKREALYWYKKAFRNGCLFSANNIATIYRDRGNERRAFFWYKRAAENNDGDALVEIGRRYYYGIGVKKNTVFALEYYISAINSNDITEYNRQEAMYYLGIAYYEGKGIRKSVENAKKWFEKANVDDDHKKAKEMLHIIAISKQ